MARHGNGGSVARALRAVAGALLALAVGGPAFALPYGVNVHVPDDAVLDATAAAGIEWIRIDVIWAWVEPSPDRFEWQIYDRVVASARSRGLRIFATIASTPAWATDGPEWTGVPRDANDWYDVCFRAAERYRGKVEAWGMWNEPNLPRFWSGRRGDYITTILRAGASAVHAADPQALVCGPELAHLQSADWEDWLHDVLASAGDVLDVVTHHVYPDGTDAGSVVRALTEGGSNPWDPPSVRSVLRDEGWLDRPFWLTETGAEAGFGDALAEQRQAAFLASLLASFYSAYRQVTWVDRIFVYEASDSAFALLGPRPNLAPRSAMGAYSAAIATLPAADADLVAVLPAPMRPGERRVVQLLARNRGATTWRAGGTFLACRADAGVLGLPATVPLAVDVPPGGETTLALELTAPAAAADLELSLRLADSTGITFGRELRSPVVVSDAAGREVVLPAAANADGLNGTRWRTDLTLLNATYLPADVTVTALEADRDNSHPRTARVRLDPRSSRRIGNVLAALFGMSGKATLRVETATPDVIASARTYTLVGSGTSGQFVPAFAVEVQPHTAPTLLLGLSRAATLADGYRSNLGLVNLEAFAVTAEVTLFGDGSVPLGRLAVDLPPYGFTQLDDAFGRVTSAPVPHGRAEIISATAGARLVAYASVVDNRSGDAVFLGPAIEGTGTLIVPAAAHAPGANHTVWRTDVVVHNRGLAPAHVVPVFVPEGAKAAPVRAAAIALPAAASLRLDDVVASTFDATGSGALVFEIDGGPVAVTSRTYNLTPEGTWGQHVPAIAPARATPYGFAVRLPQLSASADPKAGFRSNIGLFNLSDAPLELRLQLFRNPSVPATAFSVTLAPGEWRQLNDVFGAVPSTAEDGFAFVGVATPGGLALAYASVVDNVTGDPVLVPGW